jgi:VWFA-related protein
VSVQDTVSTFKLRVNLVQVHVIVRDAAGKPVEGLRKEDFQLFDNGKLQPIATFGIEDAQSRKERMEAAARTQVSEAESPAATEALPERFMAPSQTAKWNHTGEQSRQNPLPGEDHSE